MPVIRVDEDVLRALRSRAAPFEDTPNSVLRRLLGVGAERARAAAEMPWPAIRLEIEEILHFHFSDRAGTDELFHVLGMKLVLRLGKADLARDGAGEPRWRHRARAELSRMQVDGLVELGGAPNVWVLTDAGRRDLPGGG